MKPRMKKKIEEEIKRNKRFLTELIESSMKLEEIHARDVKSQEERLKELRAEVSFEDTFEGKSQEAEKMAFNTIDIILEELSSVTGKDYLLQEALTEIYRDKGGK